MISENEGADPIRYPNTITISNVFVPQIYTLATQLA